MITYGLLYVCAYYAKKFSDYDSEHKDTVENVSSVGQNSSDFSANFDSSHVDTACQTLEDLSLSMFQTGTDVPFASPNPETSKQTDHFPMKVEEVGSFFSSQAKYPVSSSPLCSDDRGMSSLIQPKLAPRTNRAAVLRAKVNQGKAPHVQL